MELRERVFVIGPNAAGKSNLLDAFRFLRDVAAPEGGLQRAVADRGGADTIRFLGAASESPITIRVEMEDGDGVKWNYHLAFKKAADGAAVLTKESVARNGGVLVARSDRKDRDLEDPLRLRQTLLEQVSANYSFRVVAEFLSQIVYLHPTPEFMRDRERVRPLAGDPLGSDLLDRVVRTPKSVQQKRMRRINALLQAALPKLDRVDVEGGEGAPPHLWVRFKDWQPTAHAQNERQLSDGTLRLFGFLWAMLDGDGPLILEEPGCHTSGSVVICSRSVPKTANES